jgi:hypothetical protein
MFDAAQQPFQVPLLSTVPLYPDLYLDLSAALNAGKPTFCGCPSDAAGAHSSDCLLSFESSASLEPWISHTDEFVTQGDGGYMEPTGMSPGQISEVLAIGPSSNLYDDDRHRNTSNQLPKDYNQAATSTNPLKRPLWVEDTSHVELARRPCGRCGYFLLTDEEYVLRCCARGCKGQVEISFKSESVY